MIASLNLKRERDCLRGVDRLRKGIWVVVEFRAMRGFGFGVGGERWGRRSGIEEVRRKRRGMTGK